MTDLVTYCFNASDGTLLWSTSASDEIGSWKCSVAVADGKVFSGKPYFSFPVMDFVGTYALDSATGDVIWSYPAGGSSPAVADGMVFTIGSGRVYAFRDGISGDTNNDGTITTADAVIALRIAIGSVAPNKEADVNRDGSVTSLDALMILQAAAGRIEI